MERGARRSYVLVDLQHDLLLGRFADLGERFVIKVGGGVAGG